MLKRAFDSPQLQCRAGATPNDIGLAIEFDASLSKKVPTANSSHHSA
jgi:hypothetical protein